MIVSHKHKFIFIKSKKTAGTSIELSLRTICGKEDIITEITAEDEAVAMKLGLPSPQNFHIEGDSEFEKFRSHFPAERIKRLVGDETWNSYYKFCFERNPFDKAISLYYWRLKARNYPPMSLSEFIQGGHLKHIKGFDIYTIDKLVAVDDLFKYEEIPQALDVISQKLQLDIPLKMLPYKAKARFRDRTEHYSKLLSPADRQVIELAFAREIYLMGYQFEQP